ncbi:MAG: HAD-IIIA family hydrolase [candidate division Zixibacteria bacterium]|nr:HAD-IIIA family hydrolase [candidate division Zixibacteria bacterium]
MTRKFLVIRLGSLGDVILSSAPVLNLRLTFPDSSISFLTRERFRPVVEMFDGVDHVITLPDYPSIGEFANLVVTLDDRAFDTIIDLHGNFRSWLIRKMTAANHKFTYPKRRRERFQLVRTHRIPPTWPHTIDLYNKAVSRAGGRVIADWPLLKTDSQSSDAGPSSLVVIAPGAKHPTKQWPLERFAQTAAKIHREHEVHIAWVVTAEDDIKLDLHDYLPASHFTRFIDRPISDLASVIGRASLVLANDSGIAHLSSAVGTPTLALFGPTHPALGFAPRSVYPSVIEVAESCRPCSLHGKKPCWREQRFCLTHISVDDVAARARAVLDQYKPLTKALILDRDGTVMVNRHYLSDPDGVQLEATVLEALTIAQNHGWKIVIVSNQSGVARGMMTVEQVERVNARLLQLLTAQGVRVDGIWYCPHHSTKGVVPEYAIDCRCRKPRHGLVEEAARQLGFSIRRSVVIGDHLDDYLMGRALGARSLIVRTGHGRETEEDLVRRGYGATEVVFPTLLAAVSSVVAEG